MNTPIYDFLTEYAERNGVRFHMPGHKGKGPLGIESLDITEVAGADVLSEATGIIGESERNAAKLFGSGKTLYTTGGSTAAIGAMLASARARYQTEERPAILAARNAHKAFLQTAALLDVPVCFMLPENAKTVYSGVMTAEEVERAIQGAAQKPFAVYITSPSYLGELWDVAAIAKVCKSHALPLLVDNAHGAYLAFLSPSLHPMQLGAAMCADSAHKTLSVLTGGAYLHIAKSHADEFDALREALALFSTTSPPYPILASLDLCNRTLCEGYTERLLTVCERISVTERRLSEAGYDVLPSEPLKIVLRDGNAEALAKHLRDALIEPELVDPTHIVFMASAENKLSDFDVLEQILLSCSQTKVDTKSPPLPFLGESAVSIRQALFAPKEEIDVAHAEGRIYADIRSSCPPAVPIAICGEIISKKTIEAFLYYGIKKIRVTK